MGHYTAKFVTETPVNDIIASIRDEMSAFSQMQLAVFHENHVCPVCPAWPVQNDTHRKFVNQGGWDFEWIGVFTVVWAIMMPFWGAFVWLLFRQALREAKQKQDRDFEEREEEIKMAAAKERTSE